MAKKFSETQPRNERPFPEIEDKDRILAKNILGEAITVEETTKAMKGSKGDYCAFKYKNSKGELKVGITSSKVMIDQLQKCESFPFDAKIVKQKSKDSGMSYMTFVDVDEGD